MTSPLERPGLWRKLEARIKPLGYGFMTVKISAHNGLPASIEYLETVPKDRDDEKRVDNTALIE